MNLYHYNGRVVFTVFHDNIRFMLRYLSHLFLARGDFYDIRWCITTFVVSAKGTDNF